MKLVAINIDGVLRGFIEKFEEMYIKELGEEGITKPFSSTNLLNHFKFKSQNVFSEYMESNEEEKIDESIIQEETTIEDEFNQFLFIDYCMEIFGYANEEYKNVFVDLKILTSKLNNLGYRVKIVSKETSRSRPATLFFLSKNFCELSTIEFVNNDIDVWVGVDAVISASPEILDVKPQGKKSIKIIKEYNKNIQSDYEILNLKELLNDKLIEKIFNTDYIDFEEVK